MRREEEGDEKQLFLFNLGWFNKGWGFGRTLLGGTSIKCFGDHVAKQMYNEIVRK